MLAIVFPGDRFGNAFGKLESAAASSEPFNDVYISEPYRANKDQKEGPLT